MPEDPNHLVKQLDYSFTNQSLLLDALTHRSADSQHNERLEFLGDAVLGMVIAHELYSKNPDAREGDMSRWRSSLVKREALAELAIELKLGEYISLGSGELKTGGQRRGSILSDTLEAILGAIYLDGGFEKCRQVILSIYATRLNNLPDPDDLKDPKTRLQEYLQSRKQTLPEYRVSETQGKAHEQRITVECNVQSLGLTARATETSRRRAEQTAAKQILDQLKPKRAS